MRSVVTSGRKDDVGVHARRRAAAIRALYRHRELGTGGVGEGDMAVGNGEAGGGGEGAPAATGNVELWPGVQLVLFDAHRRVVAADEASGESASSRHGQ